MVQPMQNLQWEGLARDGYTPLILVRHGRTSANRLRLFVGRMDVGLDPEGIEQATALGRRLVDLPLQGLYASPLSRAVETARVLGDPVHVPQLMEFDQGDWEGRPGVEVMAEFPDFFAAWAKDPSGLRVPGGETLAECQSRSVAALEALLQAHEPGSPVLVVSHQMVIHTVVLNALGLPLRLLRKLRQGNTAINLLGLRGGDWVVRRLNDCDHLR